MGACWFSYLADAGEESSVGGGLAGAVEVTGNNAVLAVDVELDNVPHGRLDGVRRELLPALANADLDRLGSSPGSQGQKGDVDALETHDEDNITSGVLW